MVMSEVIPHRLTVNYWIAVLKLSKYGTRYLTLTKEISKMVSEKKRLERALFEKYCDPVRHMGVIVYLGKWYRGSEEIVRCYDYSRFKRRTMDRRVREEDLEAARRVIWLRRGIRRLRREVERLEVIMRYLRSIVEARALYSNVCLVRDGDLFNYVPCDSVGFDVVGYVVRMLDGQGSQLTL